MINGALGAVAVAASESLRSVRTFVAGIVSGPDTACAARIVRIGAMCAGLGVSKIGGRDDGLTGAVPAFAIACFGSLRWGSSEEISTVGEGCASVRW